MLGIRFDYDRIPIHLPKLQPPIQCDISHAGTPINRPGCNQSIVVSSLEETVAVSSAPAKPMSWRKVLIAGGLTVLLAALLTGGWFVPDLIKARHLRGNLPPGLVAYWAFEGNGRDSAGNNTLTTAGNCDMSYDEGWGVARP